MKQGLTFLLAAGLVATVVGTAQADQGMPSQLTLQAMGLSSLQVISDTEAMDIRGFGYKPHGKSVAIAYGSSYAHVGGYGASAGSKDGFYAKGKHKAKGVHGSIAGKIIIKKYGGKKRGGHGGGMPQPWGNDNGGGGYTNGGGGHDGGGGHKPKGKVKVVVVFAGGFAVASAH